MSRVETRPDKSLRDALGKQYEFEVPPTMLERAINDKRADFVRKATADGKSEADAREESLSEIKADDADVAADLRSYLVVDKIARTENIEVGEDDMRMELQKMMQSNGSLRGNKSSKCIANQSGVQHWFNASEKTRSLIFS